MKWELATHDSHFINVITDHLSRPYLAMTYVASYFDDELTSHVVELKAHNDTEALWRLKEKVPYLKYRPFNVKYLTQMH